MKIIPKTPWWVGTFARCELCYTEIQLELKDARKLLRVTTDMPLYAVCPRCGNLIEIKGK